MHPLPRAGGESGQASVELVALLPLLVVVAALLWQAAVAGDAVWRAAGAARAAARAAAVGGDPEGRARATLPAALRAGTRVVRRSDGVRVAVPVPFVLDGRRLGTVTSTAAFPAQR